jgi:predicted DNA-binding protein with PD1-like motif
MAQVIADLLEGPSAFEQLTRARMAQGVRSAPFHGRGDFREVTMDHMVEAAG